MKPFKSNRIQDLARYLFGEMSPDAQGDMLSGAFAQPSGVEGVDDIVPSSIDAALGDQGGVTAGQLGKLALGAAHEHPIKTMGLAGLGLGNVAGLADNDKLGGQLGGLALGGLGAHYLAKNPYAAAMMTMGGGQLGALFDKLRAKREGQRKQIAQQQPARR